MSFSFGFSGDDYDEAESETARLEQGHDADQTVSLIPAQRHTLADLVAALPRTLAYSTLTLGGRLIPRRELWDIKHQLMSGDAAIADSAAEEAMAYMAKDDVIHGLYEGGFKTWECSLDLAEQVPGQLPAHAIELGCGTALPTLCLLDAALEQKYAMRLTVQDYNLSVLQLATIPNLFLVWLRRQNPSAFEKEGEVQVSDEQVAQFQRGLSALGIQVDGMTGAWSPAMLDLLQPVSPVCVLASETIYAPSALLAFLRLLQGLLEGGRGEGRIAAKHVYFGVGGGIRAFMEGCAGHGLVCESVYEVEQGVRRCVLLVRSTGA
ncbi:hypothetical protein BCR37DRAFT_391969 [Protomyces lactucae-debilis]|uniref:protein-histidine N-methyltransferase n=1 Tax=Protomyces lactucae-debilis TaxID=2754530 RepID=A0A1Y2FLC7_PROLT|nr:uncharacterized protein BCR37DRAFT_391969 [Protomyces lactucae-debilis]ORY84387.1 hypothetical protein BCR37DRAFT_391969 [Protomyces lactucae-debilis]